MEFIPIIYIFICYLVASALGAIRLVGVSIGFWICLFLTPLLGTIIILLFPRLPKAYCMNKFRNFQIGYYYYYRVKIAPKRIIKVSVYNGDRYDISREEFNHYFSAVKPE